MHTEISSLGVLLYTGARLSHNLSLERESPSLCSLFSENLISPNVPLSMSLYYSQSPISRYELFLIVLLLSECCLFSQSASLRAPPSECLFQRVFLRVSLS